VTSERRRLSVEERRNELIDLGMEVFSTEPYEDVRIEELADRAGISRGLLYHYFPTKRHYYVEVARAAAAEVFEQTAPDPSLSPVAQVQASLEAFLANAQERPHGFLAVYRGSLASDPEIRAILDDARQAQAERVVAAFAPRARKRRPALLVAARGWTGLVQTMTADWLIDGALPLEEVRDVLVGALRGALAAARRAEGQSGRRVRS
jgi:AcrR family transcriptional regulator